LRRVGGLAQVPNVLAPLRAAAAGGLWAAVEPAAAQAQPPRLKGGLPQAVQRWNWRSVPAGRDPAMMRGEQGRAGRRTSVKVKAVAQVAIPPVAAGSRCRRRRKLGEGVSGISRRPPPWRKGCALRSPAFKGMCGGHTLGGKRSLYRARASFSGAARRLFLMPGRVLAVAIWRRASWSNIFMMAFNVSRASRSVALRKSSRALTATPRL
jgi:hypothetical protein